MGPKISLLLSIIVILSFMFNFGSCQSVKSLNASLDGFAPAVATWFGPATSCQTDKPGECGLENDIASAPYSCKIAAGNQALFSHGKGCGACYSLYCTGNPSCSGGPITVTITDECPDTCNNDPVHFDLSGYAFGLLAKPGQENNLRNAGRIQIFYQRVQCNYPDQKIAFKVRPGSNPYYFETAVEYVNGDGDIGSLEIKPEGFTQFVSMQQVIGAVYKYDIQSGKKTSFSIMVNSGASGRSVEAQNVIPTNWAPGTRYTSSVNF